MKVCEYIQAQMLEYLYGVTGAEENRSIEEHLESCADCKQALAQARGQRQQLQSASLMEYPSVRFEAPQGAPAPVEESPRTLPMPSASSGWFRWSVAAGILLLVGGLGVHAGLDAQKRNRVQQAEARRKQIDQRLAHADDNINSVDNELQKIEERIRQLKDDSDRDLQKAWDDARKKPFQVTVTGPRSPEPGAENTYKIQIRSKTAQPMPIPGKITVRLLDQKNHKKLYEMVETATNGDLSVTLPRDLPINPGKDVQQLALEVSAETNDGLKATLEEILPIGGPIFLTHLATDKPMYQPGETLRFRSLTLERSSLRPVAEEMQLKYRLKMPSGAQLDLGDGLSKLVEQRNNELRVVLGPDNRPIRGIGAGVWAIPEDAPGGEYTLEVSEAEGKFLPLERKFIVNKYQIPRLNKELEYSKKSYGAGESVVAACKVARAEGGKPVANAPVDVTVLIDGQQYGKDGKPGKPFQLKTDAQGGVVVKFQLPKQMERGAGTVSVKFNAGDVETLVKPIPIVLNKLDVNFYPEGGDLVADVPNRVYFQVRNTMGKPAELKGRVLDDKGQVLADVQTFSDPKNPGANHGVGVFTLAPNAGAKYHLVIDEPAGIKAKHALPVVKPDGLVLSIPAGVTKASEALGVDVRSGKKDRDVLVGAYCRGRLMAHERVHVKKGENTRVTLKPEASMGGVYRVTVFEELAARNGRAHLVPRAERLIYREPTEKLKISVKPEKDRYFPGDKVKLNVSAQNENGSAAPAVVMVAVVDKSVLKLADEKTYRGMPTHFLLTSEVKKPEDLEHVDFLLTDHANARRALDLLLGTQGWRRFAEQKPTEQFLKQKPDDLPRQDVDRLLVLNGRLKPDTLKPETKNTQIEAYKHARESVWSQIRDNQDDYLALQVKREELIDVNQQVHAELQAERIEADKSLAAAVQGLRSYEQFSARARGFALPVLILALLVLAVAVAVRGLTQLREHTGHAIPYLATAACSVAVVAIIVARFSIRMEGIGNMGEFAQIAQPDAGGNVAMAPRDAELDMPLEENKNADEQGQGGGRNNRIKREKAPQADAKVANGARPPLPKPGVALPGGFAGRGQAGADKDFDQRRKLGLAEAAGKGEGKFKALEELAKHAKKQNAANWRGPMKNRGEFERMERRDRAAQLRQQANRKADGVLLLEKMKEAQLQPGRPNNANLNFPAAPPALLADALQGAREVAAAEPVPAVLPFVVREYAHIHKTAPNNARTDFTETIYWQPVLVLPDGKAQAIFDLNDSVTTFQVLAAGHTLDGRLGEVTFDLESRLPLVIEPKIPLEVTATDTLAIPVTIANNTDNGASVNLVVSPSRLALLGGAGREEIALDPQSRERRIYRFKPQIVEGEATLLLDGTGKNIRGDRIERTFKVVPDGFPFIDAKSDLLEGNAQHNLELPESWVKGTLKYNVAVYPSTLADLQQGLEAMLREPNGCFEQTSTSNYPNLLILDYLKTTDQAKPEVARRAQQLIDRGYKKLTSFECKQRQGNTRKGYEWFGGFAPPHEALTAYGLMQFRDMAAVYDVDPKMVERTRDYLMSRRDGKGGFQRNRKALDTFGRAPDNITNAYIVWALTESSKDDDVNKELAALVDQAKTSKDPYFLALVANSLMNRNRGKEAIELLKKVAGEQKADGHLDGSASITRSGGKSLQIETTSLVLLAWLKAHRPDLFNANIQKAVKWIGTQRGGRGGFGATQSTILALKALIAFANENKKTAAGGDLVLLVDGKEVARKHFNAGETEAITLEVENAEKALKPGKNNIKIEVTGNNVMPFTASWSYRTVKPVSDAGCAVKLNTALSAAKVNEGDTVDLKVHAENASGKGQGMAIAIIGLPAGLTVPEDLKQLKEYTRVHSDGKRPVIDFFEIRGRELVLYWRDLAPDRKIDLNISLIARVPGEFRGPASRSYLYYTPEFKHWINPLSIEIAAK